MRHPAYCSQHGDEFEAQSLAVPAAALSVWLSAMQRAQLHCFQLCQSLLNSAELAPAGESSHLKTWRCPSASQRRQPWKCSSRYGSKYGMRHASHGDTFSGFSLWRLAGRG